MQVVIRVDASYAKASSDITVVLYLVQIPSSQTFFSSFLQRCETETAWVRSYYTLYMFTWHRLSVLLDGKLSQSTNVLVNDKHSMASL